MAPTDPPPDSLPDSLADSLPDSLPTLGLRVLEGSRRLPGAGSASRFGSTAVLVGGVLLGVGGVGFTLLMLLFTLFGDPPDRAFAIAMTLGLGVVSVGGAAVVGGIGWWWRRRVQAAAPTRQAIGVYDHGVLLVEGDARTELAWAEVDGFLCPPAKSPIYGVQISVPYSFFVVLGKGRRFEARGMAGLEALGHHIEAATAPHRLATARARVQAGQPAVFGSITVTPGGLRGFGIGSIAWSDLQGLGVGRMNRLVAKERGVPVGQKGPFFIETPDVRALFTLVAELRSEA